MPDESLYALLDDAAASIASRCSRQRSDHVRTGARAGVLKAARKVLRGAGGSLGDTVAIALPSCPQAFVAFYACMRIGMSLQLNPLAPASEIAGRLARLAARLRRVGKVWTPTTLDVLGTVFTVDISHGVPTRHSVCFFVCPSPAARQTRNQLRGSSPRRRAPGCATARRRWSNHPLCPQVMTLVICTSGITARARSAPLTPHRNIGVNASTSACSGCKEAAKAPKRSPYSLLPCL